MNTPENRESAMERARDLLADFFDAGVVIMTWEEQGKLTKCTSQSGMIMPARA